MSNPRPGPPRGHPRLAWLVIAGMVAFLVYRTELSDPARRERLELVVMELQARLLIGAANLVPDNAKSLYRQAEQALDRGTYGQRLRFAIVAGELSGPAEASRQLQALRQFQVQGKLSPSDKQLRDAEWLERLYDHRGQQPPRPADLTDEEEAQLRRDLGWFGQLALAPPDSAEHEALLASARRAALLLPLLVVPALMAALVGLMLLVALAVYLFQGRLRSGLGAPSGHGNIYVETFALWLLLFVGLSYAASFLPRDRERVLLSGVVMLVSLAALAWPVLRGVAWRQVRHDVGLFGGRRPEVESLLGVGCYATALPLLIAGLLLMFGLMQLKRQLGFDDPFGPGGNPGHPLIEVVVRGGWWARTQVLLAGCVVAPLVEETMFRGLLYRHLREATAAWRPGWSVLASAVLVSLVFAIIHPQGLLAVPGLMALALAFALAREWRGSLLPSMVAHGLNNGVLLLGLMVMAG
jgi:membrane protease YdiL (CAAX protease family)